MSVKDVEPMIDQCPTSQGYGKPFGVVLTYKDGHKRRFSDIGLALCADLTAKQRKYVENIQKKIVANRRLDELRIELRAERISYVELAELQGLAPFIAKDDVELLEAAGVPEHPQHKK